MRSPDRLIDAMTASIRRGSLGCRRASCGFAGAARRRLSSEAGFAVPTVTLMIVAALGMAGVAVSTSIQGQGGTVRDQETKTALAVAESGVDQALLRYNRYGLSGPTPCAPVDSTFPDAEGWCPELEAAVNGGTIRFQVKPTSSELPNGEVAWTELEVVSVGTMAGTTRRVNVAASSSSGQDIFVDADVQSEDGITLDSNSQIHSGSATNGDITLGPNAKHCGPASVGLGKGLGGGGAHYGDVDCTTVGTPGEGEISLPPVEQKDAPTNNNNDRLFGEDLISGTKADACWDGLDGNGNSGSCGPRELLVDSNSSVTLGGETYSFCKLTLKSNSSLYIIPKAKAKIFFDSPEACGYEDGVTQLDLSSNARITSTPGDPVNVALLFVGSTDLATKINLNSNTAVDGPCEQNFVIYAPYTDIDLDSNTKFCGAMAGKSIHLDSNAEIWTSSGTDEFVLPNMAPHYVVERFVDCSVTSAAGPPDEGC